MWNTDGDMRWYWLGLLCLATSIVGGFVGIYFAVAHI